MEIKEDFNLVNNNSFKFEYSCSYYGEAKNSEDILSFIDFSKHKEKKILVLGEGTNVILSNDIDYSVLCIKSKGKRIEGKTVTVSAGENWHDFVLWTLKNNFFGLENLSLIPGTVGAAPIQNIGAYGVEVSDFIESVTVIDYQKQEEIILSKENLGFSYRSSLFKENRNLLIKEITFKLLTSPNTNTSYKALQEFLIQDDIDPEKATPLQICRSVTEIRKSSLPDHLREPNVGSFFHNLIVDDDCLNSLLEQHPELPFFRVQEGTKIPIAYLIEQNGWKGSSFGCARVSDKHSLVLISEDKESTDLLLLAQKISDDLFNKYNLEISLEPTVVK